VTWDGGAIATAAATEATGRKGPRILFTGEHTLDVRGVNGAPEMYQGSLEHPATVGQNASGCVTAFCLEASVDFTVQDLRKEVAKAPPVLWVGRSAVRPAGLRMRHRPDDGPNHDLVPEGVRRYLRVARR
jgi:hypothetical protein